MHALLLSTYISPLLSAALDDGWGVLVLDGAALGAASLDRPDDSHGLLVAGNDLAEDDVTAVQPRGDDGGDELWRIDVSY